MAAELKAYPVPEKFSVNEAASLFEVWMQDKAIAPSEFFCFYLKGRKLGWAIQPVN